MQNVISSAEQCKRGMNHLCYMLWHDVDVVSVSVFCVRFANISDISVANIKSEVSLLWYLQSGVCVS